MSCKLTKLRKTVISYMQINSAINKNSAKLKTSSLQNWKTTSKHLNIPKRHRIPTRHRICTNLAKKTWATSYKCNHINLQKIKQLYQEEDQYVRQTNFKEQRNSKPRKIQWRKQLLLHIKGPLGWFCEQPTSKINKCSKKWT